MEKYEGRFGRLLELAAGSAVALLASVLAEFPCFRDGAAFEGRRVTFHKRAQILVSDIWCLFSGIGFRAKRFRFIPLMIHPFLRWTVSLNLGTSDLDFLEL